MKKLVLVIALSLTQFAYGTKPQATIVYGDDNREDIYHVRNELFLKLAKSSAAFISNHSLKDYSQEEVELSGETLLNKKKCETERFVNQPAVASCSGFLIGKNKIATAGHCVQDKNSCLIKSWVFDYKMDFEGQEKILVEKKNIYKCINIIAFKNNPLSKEDYAIVELDRDVIDREPLELRSSGKLEVGDELVVIGHPSGLPTKIADGANVRAINDIYFTANLDTFSINSGSGVFNAKTGLVEGILVRGDMDYIWTENKCEVVNQVGNDEGRGEEVTLITRLPKI